MDFVSQIVEKNDIIKWKKMLIDKNITFWKQDVSFVNSCEMTKILVPGKSAVNQMTCIKGHNLVIKHPQIFLRCLWKSHEDLLDSMILKVSNRLMCYNKLRQFLWHLITMDSNLYGWLSLPYLFILKCVVIRNLYAIKINSVFLL